MMKEEKVRIALAVKAAIGETPGPARTEIKEALRGLSRLSRVRCSIVFKKLYEASLEVLDEPNKKAPTKEPH